jgi:type I restriction enzyme S subunit
MIANLKPYPTMKNSGVPWLEGVPPAWEVRKVRGILRRVTERNRSDLPLLSVVRERGVIHRDTTNEDENRNYIPDDLSNYKVVRVGQFAMNKMKAWQGSYGVSPYEGIVSPAYFVFRLAGVEGRFFHTAIRSRAYVPSFAKASDGVRVGQWDLAESRMREIPFAIPPLPEQAAIVRFLDYADRRIRRYIRAKQKLIKLLEEQKQAIIHRGVTRGLDPNVRLKPSGVDWLGDVPEHWEVSRVKNEFLCLNQRRVPLSATERGAMTLRSYDYYGASGVIDKVDEYLFHDELLLIAEDGANLVLRNLPLAIIARGKFWVNNHAHILKPRRGNLEYLAAVMERINYEPWISGAAQPKLTKDRLMGIAIAVAPPGEQDQIVEAQNEETAPLRATIERARREIDLLRELRTRLIADVVTGKLDVREAAAGLPDEVEEPEPLDQIDADGEADEAGADDVEEVPEEAEA